MGFIENLEAKTGTEKFWNSGVGLRRSLDTTKLDFDAAGEGVAGYFLLGAKFMPTHLSMPANCLTQDPHCHPGGEFAYVTRGEYFDADMEGNPIQTYTTGTTIFYNNFSTHRPLSREGADIIYIAFDGIVFGKSPEDLAGRMTKIGTTEEAVEYALTWMISDKEERQRLMDLYVKK